MADNSDFSQDFWHPVVEREQRRKRFVFFLTVLTLAVIAAGSVLFLVNAYVQRDAAIAQRDLAVRASTEANQQRTVAELARDEASSLLLRVQRSSFVVATSPDRDRSISRSGWLLDESGGPMTFLGDSVNAAQFSPDGKLAVVMPTSPKSTAFLISAYDGKTVYKLSRPIRFAIFSSDGKSLVVLPAENLLQAQSIDVASGAITKTFDVPTEAMKEVDALRNGIIFAAFSPDSQLVITATNDYATQVWKTDTGYLWATARGAAAPIRGIAFNAGLTKYLIMYSNGRAIVTELKPRAPTTPFDGYFH